MFLEASLQASIFKKKKLHFAWTPIKKAHLGIETR